MDDGDFLVTYDPKETERHTDSSDFEATAVSYDEQKRRRNVAKRTNNGKTLNSNDEPSIYAEKTKSKRHRDQIIVTESNGKRVVIAADTMHIQNVCQKVQSRTHHRKKPITGVIPCLSHFVMGKQVNMTRDKIGNECVVLPVKCHRFSQQESYVRLHPVFTVKEGFSAHSLRKARRRSVNGTYIVDSDQSIGSSVNDRIKERYKRDALEKALKRDMQKEYSNYIQQVVLKNNPKCRKSSFQNMMEIPNVYRKGPKTGYWDFILDKMKKEKQSCENFEELKNSLCPQYNKLQEMQQRELEVLEQQNKIDSVHKQKNKPKKNKDNCADACTCVESTSSSTSANDKNITKENTRCCTNCHKAKEKDFNSPEQTCYSAPNRSPVAEQSPLRTSNESKHSHSPDCRKANSPERSRRISSCKTRAEAATDWRSSCNQQEGKGKVDVGVCSSFNAAANKSTQCDCTSNMDLAGNNDLMPVMSCEVCQQCLESESSSTASHNSLTKPKKCKKKKEKKDTDKKVQKECYKQDSVIIKKKNLESESQTTDLSSKSSAKVQIKISNRGKVQTKDTANQVSSGIKISKKVKKPFFKRKRAKNSSDTDTDKRGKTVDSGQECESFNKSDSVPKSHCQKDHDSVVKALKGKYNREVICIHQPPCLVINGCLNMPPMTKGVTTLHVQERRSIYQKLMHKSIKKEQSCQWHEPFTEVERYQSPKSTPQLSDTSGEVTQVFCTHQPPCQIVPKCLNYKKNFSLYSCAHVPMCKNLNECGGKSKRDKNLSHVTPPIQLTAKESISTQVEFEVNVCRHMPHCVMIPKCLGRILSENYLPYEAIPSCTHQPPCEMIPACCRKTPKDMVSKEGLKVSLRRAPLYYQNRIYRSTRDTRLVMK